jgi:hypothetical protein
MDITYTQKDGIKLTGKGFAIVLDGPLDAKADVALFSSVQEARPSLTSFDSPGEYEVKGCMIDGVSMGEGATAFRVDMEDIRLGYLPAFPAEGEKNIEALAGADALFVPLEGVEVEKAAKLVASLEPKIVMPIKYSEAELKAFLAEMGAKDVEPVEKFKLQRKDIEEDKQQTVVLQG